MKERVTIAMRVVEKGAKEQDQEMISTVKMNCD